MAHVFRAGGHVEWNSEADYVRGTSKKKVISAIKFKTYTVRASKEEPQAIVARLQTSISPSFLHELPSS